MTSIKDESGQTNTKVLQFNSSMYYRKSRQFGKFYTIFEIFHPSSKCLKAAWILRVSYSTWIGNSPRLSKELSGVGYCKDNDFRQMLNNFPYWLPRWLGQTLPVYLGVEKNVDEIALSIIYLSPNFIHCPQYILKYKLYCAK